MKCKQIVDVVDPVNDRHSTPKRSNSSTIEMSSGSEGELDFFECADTGLNLRVKKEKNIRVRVGIELSRRMSKGQLTNSTVFKSLFELCDRHVLVEKNSLKSPHDVSVL